MTFVTRSRAVEVFLALFSKGKVNNDGIETNQSNSYYFVS